MKIAVTGATGHLGGKIVEHLLKLTDKNNIIALVHNKKHAQNLLDKKVEVREFDFQNKASLDKALEKVDTLVYVASKTYKLLDRIKEFENVLQAMKDQDVKNIVAMSFIADQRDNPFVIAPFYAYLPVRLAGSNLNYAIGKNVLYADPLVPYLPELIERKALIYPLGDQKMSFISINDSAEAFAKMALSDSILKSRKTYILTQARSYTMPELGEVMTKVTGHMIGYQPVSVKEFGEIYASKGDGNELASMYAGGAKGMLTAVSDDFAHIMGHEPQSMEEFLQENYRS